MISTTRTRLIRALGGVVIGASLLVAPNAGALDLQDMRGRVGPPVDASGIEGGALALTFAPEAPPAWLTWLGEDIHLETAVSLWDDAKRSGGGVYTAHIGPTWSYRPTWLGDCGFFELGTSVAYVSEHELIDRDLGSRGHFTSHATVGWHLGAARRWHAGLRVRHTSNAGLGSPNPGLDIVMLELGYRWRPAP